MAKVEMSFEQFIYNLEFICDKFIHINEKRTSQYKRGSDISPQLQEMEMILQSIRTQAPPNFGKGSNVKDAISSGRLQPERAGNPLFFHKIIIETNFNKKAIIRVVPMNDSESIKVMMR